MVRDITVSLSIAATSDAGLTAVLIAPNGTQIPLFSGLSGQNLVNTVFSDSAESSITQGTAPYTGTFIPAYTPAPPRSAAWRACRPTAPGRSRSPTAGRGTPARWTPGR